VPAAVFTHRLEEAGVVTIGIDPHKATHTAVAVDDTEEVLAELEVRARGDVDEDAAEAWIRARLVPAS
jgi:hypothetical protein